MNNVFDSRTLNFTDAYGQRFMKEGWYHYDLIPAAANIMNSERPFTIEVIEAPRGHKMDQHTVLVDLKQKRFLVDNSELQVRVGDLVLWCCRDQQAPAFEIISDKDFFGSGRLMNECGYAHAFGFAGEYPWADAFGSKLSGVVRVHDPKTCDEKQIAQWRKKLTKGLLVMINGEKAEPAEIDIVTGQTVYFAVVNSNGISVTDQNILKLYSHIKQPLDECRGKKTYQ